MGACLIARKDKKESRESIEMASMAMSTSLASNAQALCLGKSDFTGRSLQSRQPASAFVKSKTKVATAVRAGGYADELVKTAVSARNSMSVEDFAGGDFYAFYVLLNGVLEDVPACIGGIDFICHRVFGDVSIKRKPGPCREGLS